MLCGLRVVWFVPELATQRIDAGSWLQIFVTLKREPLPSLMQVIK